MLLYFLNFLHVPPVPAAGFNPGSELAATTPEVTVK